MRISSGLITGLSRAFQRARPALEDSDPTIPALLMPVLSLRQPLQAFTAASPDATVAQETSWSFFLAQQRANQGDAGNVLGVLAPGIWECYWQASFQSNADVGGSLARLEVVTVVTPDQRFRLYQFQHRIGTFYLAGVAVFSVAADAIINLFTPGNGVGQTNEHTVTFLFSKLN